MSKPPIAIRLIAWALIVLGTFSISEILVQFFFYDQIHMDLSLFLVPIGMGLLRRSEFSRWCASVALGFGCLGIFIELAANIYDSFYEQPDSVMMDLGLLPCAVLLVVFVWAWKESCSEKTRRWIASKSCDDEVREPFQFRLSTLLYCTTLLAFVCIVYREDVVFQPIDIQSEVRGTWEGTATVTSGLRRPRWGKSQEVIDFVVIETMIGNGPFSSSFSRSSSSGRTYVTLDVPNGRAISLPGEMQLYEINDGVFRASRGKVTVQQLEAYLDQSWDDLSIDGLLAMPLAEEANKSDSPPINP